MAEKDTKFSWIILTMITFLVFLEAGIVKGYSVLLPDLKEQLTSQTWIIGSSISIIYGWGYVLGLSANVLVSAIGVRPCLVVTGLISSMGLVVCSLASDELTLLFGLLLLGFMMLQENVAMGIIPDYFEKYYHIAVNVYCFGTALAIIVSPLLMQIFLDLYGWRGALLLLCGINAQSIIFGSLVKSAKTLEKESEPEKKALLKSKKGSARKHRHEHHTLRTLLQKALKILDSRLLTSIPFIARVFLPGMINGYILASWLIYIMSFALSNGATMKESSIVASWGGVGVAIIRIALPTLNKYFTYRQLMYTGSIVMSGSLAATTFSHSVIAMSSTSFIFGMVLGTTETEVYVAAKDVAEDQYLNAISWFHLAFGFGSVAGGTFTGIFFDMTGSFDISFWLLSSVALLTTISLWLEDAWNRGRSNSGLPK